MSKHIHTMSDRHIRLAKHAIGLDRKKPYTQHGKKFYKPYRNYYDTYTNDIVWKDIADEGYAAHNEPDEKGRVVYWLTEKGREWLGNELGITIYEEER